MKQHYDPKFSDIQALTKSADKEYQTVPLLLLEEQSDQGLHYHYNNLSKARPFLYLNFRVITANIWNV